MTFEPSPEMRHCLETVRINGSLERRKPGIWIARVQMLAGSRGCYVDGVVAPLVRNGYLKATHWRDGQASADPENHPTRVVLL